MAYKDLWSSRIRSCLWCRCSTRIKRGVEKEFARSVTRQIHHNAEVSSKGSGRSFYLKVLPQKSLEEPTLPTAPGPQDIAAEDAALRLLLLQIDALVSRY